MSAVIAGAGAGAPARDVPAADVAPQPAADDPVRSPRPERILMVTPYPPLRDGIAAYALQEVAALRAAGNHVEVLSTGPSAAHHHLDLVGPRGALALAKRVRAYDRVIVQFHPDFFYPVPNGARDRAAVSSALLVAFRLARTVEVRVHEIDYRYGRGLTPDVPVNRALWRSVDRIVVHTPHERAEFVAAFGVDRARVVVAEHGQHFARRTRADRDRARRSLGIEPDAYSFLSIGFIQPHKGFDRAVAAFAGLGATGCRFDVVGSVRVEDPAYLAYLAELEALVAATDGTHLHAGFVSDELFDRWIVAADVVVLPYRSIWSSGVLERAALYDRPVIATDVGGLAEQAGHRASVTLVANTGDDAELRAAMWAAAGERVAASTATADPWPREGPELHRQVQDQVRIRAARGRGSRLWSARARAGSAGTGSAGAGFPESPAPDQLARVSAATAPLRRVPVAALPPTSSGRSSSALVKRVVRRLTAWQLEPLVGEINALRAGAIEAVERLGADGAAAADRLATDRSPPTASAGTGSPPQQV